MPHLPEGVMRTWCGCGDVTSECFKVEVHALQRRGNKQPPEWRFREFWAGFPYDEVLAVEVGLER